MLGLLSLSRESLLKSGCVSPHPEVENKVFIVEFIEYFDSWDKSFENCLVFPLTRLRYS